MITMITVKRKSGNIKHYWQLIKVFFEPLWRKLALIVGLGFLVRLFVYGYIKIPWIIFDEYLYLDTARQIIRGTFISQLSRDPQLYPPGWSIVLAAFVGFIKNPFTQYQAALWLTMLLSSIVPLAAFWLTRSLWVSVLLAFYPPLFVYSSSIMSETMFVLMLFVLLTLLKDIVRDDFTKRRSLILAALVMGFFLFYTRLVRSFGVVLLPSLVLAGLFVCYLQYRQGSLVRLRSLLFFLILTVFFYYGFSYLGSLWLLPKNGFYERSVYIESIISALKQPQLTWVLLRNELSLSLFWWFWILPLFFVSETIKTVHKREWQDLLPRVWAVLIYVFSLGLTLAHMFIGSQKNPQYLVFSRYLDPALVLLFAYGVADFVKYIAHQTKLKIPVWLWLVLGYFVFYFVLKLTKIDYKFGNTMSIYFFLNLVKEPMWLWLLAGLSMALFYTLFRDLKTWLFYLLALFFVVASYLSISNTLSTPEWVMNKYQGVIKEWQQALSRFPNTDVPICIHENGISSETYYLYHFLYPYQYLHNCKHYENKPKRILTKKKSQMVLPIDCVTDFRFTSGESLLFCPLGY